MKGPQRAGSCIVLAILTVAASPAPSGEYDPVVVRPEGPYRAARLRLSEGLHRKPQVLMLTFRDGRCAGFWFVDQGYERINLVDSSLRLTDADMTGVLRLRLVGNSQKYDAIETAVWTWQVGVADGELRGSYTVTVEGRTARSWSGAAEGEYVTGSEALADGSSWPAFAGPHGNMSVQGGPEIVSDLSLAKPVWRSEATLPVSYGNAPDSRYFTRAAGARSGGGSCSPVVAGGMVYVGFHRPSRSSPVDFGNRYFTKRFPTEADLEAFGEKHELLPEEVDAVTSHFRPHADDVIVAMDARTGATVWTARFPMRSFNKQTHKHRGLAGVPLVASGMVFYPNLHGRIYALAADTGEVAWEWPEFTGPPETKWGARGPQNPSPLLIGETLVWASGRTSGLVARTGTERWRVEFSGYGMQRWRHEGRDYVVANSPKGAICIDPADGRTVWRHDAVLGFSQGYGNQSASESCVDGDVLVSFRKTGGEKVEGKKKPYVFKISGWRLSPGGMEQAWEDEPFAPDENLCLTVSNGVVYAVGKHVVRCLDPQTGRHLGSIEEADFPDDNARRPRSNPWLMVVGEKMILSPEGQHGKHGFMLFESDPGSLKMLGGLWVPPHATTTAYNGQPLVYPIVDGRIFMRGGDGIYCYDLRSR